MKYKIEVVDDLIYIWGDLPLDDLLQIMIMYKNQGFDYVWHEKENSTLCLGKKPIDMKDFK